MALTKSVQYQGVWRRRRRRYWAPSWLVYELPSQLYFKRLSGGSATVPTPDGGRGASQCTHSPLSQAKAHNTATTATPHWPLSHTAQNQNG